MKGKELSDEAVQNKVGILAHTVEASIISAAYIVETLRGARTLFYVLCLIVIAVLPVVIEWSLYAKNKDSKIIRKVLGYGYAALYILVMFTTTNPLVFVYVIPMLIAITAYNDVKFSLKINIGVIVINIIQVVLMMQRGHYTMADITTIEIQMLVMILTSVYSIYTSLSTNRISDRKISQLEEHQKRVAEAHEKSVEASKYLADGIESIHEKIGILSESLDLTKEAMVEVNAGSTDTADAVQKQLTQTEAIQGKVADVSRDNAIIIESTNITRDAITQGNEHVSLLVNQMEKSVESGAEVSAELSSLDAYMTQMHSIVDLINGITKQTSLLALNASIEAARAGEAGKGFAVVATEISQMATQTQDATVNITKLIENVSSAINKVIRVTENMVHMIESQNETTAMTAESFQVIQSHSEKVANNAEELAKVVEELEQANKEIVDSISTISAISEEVAAHASDTLQTSEENLNTIQETSRVAGELQEYARNM